MTSKYNQEIHHMIDPTVPELSALETMRHSAAHLMADAIANPPEWGRFLQADGFLFS